MPHVFQLALLGSQGRLGLTKKAGEFLHFQGGRKNQMSSLSIHWLICDALHNSFFRFPRRSYQRACGKEHGLKGKSVIHQRFPMNLTWAGWTSSLQRLPLNPSGLEGYKQTPGSGLPGQSTHTHLCMCMPMAGMPGTPLLYDSHADLWSLVSVASC